ncbi:MAG: type 4a pilus biogenesis protein PilO [Pirellulales bacterium]|nr:type 4a pilus biogenesis protein PilO [Pirellulales bacterium]
MRKIPRRNSLIVTIPLAAAAAAWVVILFLPIQRAIGRLQDEAQQMEDYCHRSELLLPALQRMGRDLAGVRQRIGYWEETSPAPDELTSLLGEITAAAREAGVRTTRFDPQPVVMHDRIAEMPVSIGVTGSFVRVFTLLSKLESMSPTIWVDRLEIEKIGKARGSVLCEIDFAVFMDNPENSDQANDLGGR